MNSYNCCDPSSLQASNISKLSKLLNTICSENKLQILCLLKDKEHCVCEILEKFKISQSLASHHLSDLKSEGLVTYTKDGRQSFYSLTKMGQAVVKTLFSIYNT